jgi:tetratricopeptide (TPR) repeat protein
MQAAAAIAERLVALAPANVVRRRELALASNDAGFALIGLKRPDEAIVWFRKALAAHQSDAAAAHADDLSTLINLGSSHEGIAEASILAGRADDALAAFAQAAAAFEKVVALDAGSFESRRILAYYLKGIGQILTAAGRLTEAVPPLRRRLALIEGLVTDEPANARWQRELVITLFLLARAGNEARTNLARALTLAKQLAQNGQLGAAEAGWVALLEKTLADLPT